MTNEQAKQLKAILEKNNQKARQLITTQNGKTQNGAK